MHFCVNNICSFPSCDQHYLSHLAVFHLHVTQIVFVVRERVLTLRAGPLGWSAWMTAASCGSGVTPWSLVVLIGIIVIVLFFLFFLLLLLPTPVLSIRVIRLSRGFWLEARGTRRVGWSWGGVSAIGLRLLFGGRASVSGLSGTTGNCMRREQKGKRRKSSSWSCSLNKYDYFDYKQVLMSLLLNFCTWYRT